MMNREEILEKSRQEKRDEGKEYTFNIGRKSGVIGMVIIFTILTIFNLYNNHRATNFALVSLFLDIFAAKALEYIM